MLLRLSAGILMLAATSACATHAIQPPVSDAACVTFKIIRYAVPPIGTVNDPGNKLDTAETVADLQDHNAKYRAICGE